MGVGAGAHLNKAGVLGHEMALTGPRKGLGTGFFQDLVSVCFRSSLVLVTAETQGQPKPNRNQNETKTKLYLVRESCPEAGTGP